MKKLVIIILILAMGIAAFAKESGKERRAEREAALIEQTQNLIESENWQFEATRMLPSAGGSRSITSNYGVLFKTDMMESYLPFIGRAYSADYGSNQSPMIFESGVENYSVKEGRNGATIISFHVRNKSDRMDFVFNISPNGSTSLNVNSTNRGNITYHGNIVELEAVKA